MNKLIFSADFVKGKLSLAELEQLPVRYMHFLFRSQYIKNEKIKANPNGPEAKQEQAEATTRQLAETLGQDTVDALGGGL